MICTYQDHAEDEEIAASPVSEKETEPDFSDHSVFPVKLHNMLTDMEKQGSEHGKRMVDTVVVAQVQRAFKIVHALLKHFLSRFPTSLPSSS